MCGRLFSFRFKNNFALQAREHVLPRILPRDAKRWSGAVSH